MERRQFLGRGAAIGGALLARNTLGFARRNLGVGAGRAETESRLPPRATSVTGRIANAEGRTVTVALTSNEQQSVRVLVVRRAYPTGAALARTASDSVRLDAARRTNARLTVPREGRNRGAWFYEVYVRAEREDGRRAYLCESSPYRWAGDRGTETADAQRIAEARPPVNDPAFTRHLSGNDYVLRYRWRDAHGEAWALEYRLRRSTYEAAVERERGYVETYEESLSSPVARDLAETLATDARRIPGPGEDGRETPDSAAIESLDAGRRFDELVQFVQDLPYARDADSCGTYDYNRTVEETLVAGIGDCKDRTYLLSGLLSTAFGCETVLLFQPGHLLLGVAPEDVPELPYEFDSETIGGREYVPIEPSLHVPVGFYPEEPFVAVYGDGEWLHYDVEAMAGGVDGLVRDWLEKADPVPQVF